MKACVLRSVGNIDYCDVASPKIEDSELIVDIHACGICSSDIPRIFVNGTYHFPTIPGHEFSGIVSQVRDSSLSSFLNKKVVVFPLIPCNCCEACRQKNYALCSNYNYYGSRCDGGFAEQIGVNSWNVKIIDQNVDYRIAALTEPSAVALHAVRKLKIDTNAKILIIGNGTIGLLVSKWCKTFGFNDITIVSRSDFKNKIISNLGFKHSDISELNDSSFDAVFECIGDSVLVNKSFDLLKPHGKLILIGNPSGDFYSAQKNYWKILRKELYIYGSWNSDYNNSADDWQIVVDNLLADKEFYSQLITHVFKMKDIKQALDIMKNKTDPFVKIMVEAYE